MEQTTRPPSEQRHSDSAVLQTLGAAILGATARLAVIGGAATLLFVVLVNEIATAAVYMLAAVLALMFSCCPGLR